MEVRSRGVKTLRNGGWWNLGGNHLKNAVGVYI
jgi:hypothetical protein